MADVVEEDASNPLFDLSKKKKKKKVNRDDPEKETDENTTDTMITTTKEKKSKSVAFAADSSENKEKPVEQQSTGDMAAAATGGGGGDEDDDLDLTVKKKKKKRPTPKDTTASATGETDIKKEVTGGTGGDETTSDTTSVQGEYTYEDLLTRVFNIIREKNPGVIDGDKVRLTLKPPQVARIGTKRTSFSNFGEICKSLKRQEKHLHQYLLAELGTNGSIDANNALTIKGRFQQKQIESVLRSYIKEYVICKTCRSPDTLLQKEERLSVLLCNNCRSRYFVSGIKTGFQAQVGKRAATRAKAT